MIYGSVPYGSTPLASLISLLGPEVIAKKLKFYYRNILETSTISVTSENSSYPKYRLYDRNIGLIFKATTTPSTWSVINDQGTGNQYPVDTVIIPDGHNLNGLILKIRYGLVYGNWSQACAWVGESGQMIKHFNPIVARYWIFDCLNPISPPEFHELFLTSAYELERGPSWDYEFGIQENINRLESRSGSVQKTKWGQERKIRNYSFEKLSEGQRTTTEIMRDLLGGIKNFYFEDLQGNVFFAEFPEEMPFFRAQPVERWTHTMRIREVLP